MIFHLPEPFERHGSAVEKQRTTSNETTLSGKSSDQLDLRDSAVKTVNDPCPLPLSCYSCHNSCSLADVSTPVYVVHDVAS
jgi:hypothetical protein